MKPCKHSTAEAPCCPALRDVSDARFKRMEDLRNLFEEDLAVLYRRMRSILYG